jgi:hypothetical protein
MTPLQWTVKSTRTLARELTQAGHKLRADTVAGLLREKGFNLLANAKSIEGGQHTDRTVMPSSGISTGGRTSVFDGAGYVGS